MLIEANKKAFADILRGTAEVYGKEASPNVMRLFWAALARYDIEQIESAFTVHVKTSRFMPTIADIIEKIESTNPALRRLGPEEAWASVPKSEEESGVMTDEMMAAWTIAKDFIHSGDMISARMAFKEAYTRECEAAKIAGKPVNWFLSRGHDGRDIEHVVKEGMRLGRLPQKTGEALLLECGYKAPINPNNLLAGPKDGAPNSEAAREALGKLKLMLQEIRHANP